MSRVGCRRAAIVPAWGVLVLVASVAAAEPAPAPPPTRLTPADWRADLEFARDEIPRRHVEPWHTMDQAAYQAAFESLVTDAGRLDEHQVVVRLAEIVAGLGDGHSRLTLPMDPAAGFFSGHTGTAMPRIALFRHLPLRMVRTVDGYVVTEAGAALAGLLGQRVTGIDGHDIAAVEAALSPVVSRDNAHQLHDLLPWFMVVPEVLQARGIAPSTERTLWRFEEANGRSHTVTLAPVERGATVDWRRLPPADWPTARPAEAPPGLWFSDIEAPRAVYVRIAEVAGSSQRSFAGFADDLQAHLGRTDRRRLILDLRGNPGGDNSLNPVLVRALIRTPWVSEPGALLVLIDGGTFSAAMNLVEDLEHWLPAVFVGSGTGARPNSHGDARKLELPRSGLTLRLSTLYWQNHPRDLREAIEPLVPASVTAADLRGGRDPVARALAGLDATTVVAAGRWQGSVAVDFRQLPVVLELPTSGGAQGTLRIADLGVDAAEVQRLEPAAQDWRGHVRLRNTLAPLALRASGNRLIGWIEYRGNRYPLVLSRD